MSVRINPCHGCPIRKGCDLKTDFSRKVAGLGLRSATFNCARLAERLAPGTRIVVTMPVFGPTEYGDAEVVCSRHEVPATIVTSKGNAFACIVDLEAVKVMEEDGYLSETADPNKIRFRKTMKHTRIVRFLNEDKREMCMFGNPMLPSGKCDTRDNACSCVEVKENASQLARLDTGATHVLA